MPKFKITLEDQYIGGPVVERVINGMKCYPFSMNNKGSLIITADNSNAAAGKIAWFYSIKQEWLKAQQVKHLRR